MYKTCSYWCVWLQTLLVFWKQYILLEQFFANEMNLSSNIICFFFKCRNFQFLTFNKSVFGRFRHLSCMGTKNCFIKMFNVTVYCPKKWILYKLFKFKKLNLGAHKTCWIIKKSSTARKISVLIYSAPKQSAFKQHTFEI